MVDLSFFKILCFSTVLGLIGCFNSTNKIPQDWRIPKSQEVDDKWRSLDSERYLHIKGDFNGDNIVDEARILARKNGEGFGLFVFVSQDRNKTKSYMLGYYDDMSLLHAMGISIVLPGLYKTACGKGYWICKQDEFPEIIIKYDAINYFKTESANSYFYWDEGENKFKRIWISD